MGWTRWHDEYSVGIAEIDDQHKELIDCISGLERAVETGDTKQRWSAIHYAIVQLSDYTRIHFSVEESLMRILDFPDRETHAGEHRKFVTYLRNIERKSITQDVREDDIVSFLRNWLLTHVLNEDRKYSEYFAAAKVQFGRNRKKR